MQGFLCLLVIVYIDFILLTGTIMLFFAKPSLLVSITKYLLPVRIQEIGNA